MYRTLLKIVPISPICAFLFFCNPKSCVVSRTTVKETLNYLFCFVFVVLSRDCFRNVQHYWQKMVQLVSAVSHMFSDTKLIDIKGTFPWWLRHVWYSMVMMLRSSTPVKPLNTGSPTSTLPITILSDSSTLHITLEPLSLASSLVAQL